MIVSKLQPIWEPKFSPFSFACRKGRGTHGALLELQRQVRKVSQGGNKEVFALQLDFASFFVSIRKSILKNLFLKHIHPNDQTLIHLIHVFMDHDPRADAIIQSRPALMNLIPESKSWFHRGADEGLPIGNLTSQFGANVYLNDLDHYIVRTLRPLAYIRYMDDLTLLHRDPNVLQEMIKPIEEWIRINRKQELNPSKTVLSSMRKGIEYLGYKIIQTDNSKNPARIHSTRKRKWDFVKDLRNLENKFPSEGQLLHPLATGLNHKKARTRLTSVNSRLGLLKHSDSYQFKKKALMHLKKHYTSNWISLDESGVSIQNNEILKIKKDLSAVVLP